MKFSVGVGFSVFLLLLASGPLTAHSLEFGLGGNYSDFSYTEQSNVDSENGWMPSYIAELKADLTASTQLELRYSHGAFTSTYKGATLNTNIPVISTSPITMYDYQGLINQNLAPSFYMFAGLGYHNWDRQVGGTPGYPDEVYSWMYFPFGLEFSFLPEANQEMRVHLEVQQMFNSKLVGTYQGYSPVNVTLGSKTNFLLKLPIRWNPGASFMVETTPWFEYSSIGQSNSVAVPTGISSTGYLVEPNSTAYQYGLEVLFIYKM